MIRQKTSNQPSIVHIGTVIDIHLNTAGVPLFTVEDYNGNIFYPCSMMSHVAGADGRFTLSAPAVGSVVVLLANPQPTARNYFILGGIMHPEDSQAIRADGLATALEADQVGGTSHVAQSREPYYVNQDYELTHVSDYHVQNLNSYLNMSDVHGVTLRGSPRISLEIGDDASKNVFRLAAGGYAGNRLLNAESFLNRLFTHIDELQAKVTALESAINTISPALINNMASTSTLMNATAPGSGAALLAQSQQVSTAQTELSAVPAPRDVQTVRDECESDKNPYIIIP